MSVAPVSSETIPEGMSEGKSGTLPAFIEAKLPIMAPIVKEPNITKSCSLAKDNVGQCESEEIPDSNIDTEHSNKDIATSLIDGVLKNTLDSNVNKSQDIMKLEVSTSLNTAIRSCKNDITNVETNSAVKTCILECYDDEQIKVDNEIIDLPSKTECVNPSPSTNKCSDSIEAIEKLPALKDSYSTTDTESEQFSMILQKPDKMQNTIISEEIKSNGTKSCDEVYKNLQITGQLNKDQDEDFPCPLRPLSPQSQLRDLCKRGDADHLEDFLAEICDSEEVQSSIHNQTDGIKKIQCTLKIDKSKIDLDAATEDGWTALHDIITHECQFTDVARVLLRYSANVNTQDIHGDSPLHSSLLYHNTDNIELLLKYSANVEATNASGRKPIHIANDAESLELLLNYGASVNSQDRIGNTPLHYAVVAKDIDRVKLLLERGCDVDISNKTGASPLHISSDLEIATQLLNAAANPNATDQNGNIALHVAVKGRHKEWAKLLISWKGDPHLSNKNGKTPVNLAKDKEMKNILQGKSTETTGAANSGELITTIKKIKAKVNIAHSTGTITDGQSLLPYPPTSVVSSPGILKRRIHQIGNESDEKPKGPRLRFSDVNDYSGVEELLPPKRVKVRPMYLEPQFSSDDD